MYFKFPIIHFYKGLLSLESRNINNLMYIIVLSACISSVLPIAYFDHETY